MEVVTRPTRLEVNVDAFFHNINEIKKIVNDIKIMPVIKANGYGTYLNKNLDVINQFDIVAVATVDEGVDIRKEGYQKEIFLLNQAYTDEIEKIIDNNLTVGISSDSFLEALGKESRNVTVHIEIGTGMGRTGINPSRVREFTNKILSYGNIKIEGIYTHLSSADVDFEYTNKQLESFNNAVEELKSIIGDVKYIHAAASNGILNFSNSYYNLVRPGMIMYGYESFEGARDKIDLRPVATLKSKIILLKTVPENISIGYSRSFITKRETKVATVPIGYADGLKRSLSNKGYVIVNNKKVPIIGKICMDSFMIDVTDLEDVKVGDDIYVWDNNIITLDEISTMAGTINYEMLSTISSRVPRIFVKD